MTQPKPDAQEVEARLKSLTDYVQNCELRVLKGEIMDLDGLDRNVVEVCDAITALDPEQGRNLEPKMKNLIGNLEMLADAMRLQQDKLGKTAGGR